MREIFKTIFIIAITLIITLLISANTVHAANTVTQTPAQMMNSADAFIQKGKTNSKISASDAKNEILPIANVLVAIASVVFLVVGGILGVQYAYAGADQKAGIKQKLIWFVVAVVLVYGATGIFNIAVNVFSKISN